MTQTFFKKLLSLLRIRTHADGLEISDQVIRFAYVARNAWQMEAVRLPPGVMEKGKIKDAAAFSAALEQLREKILSGRKRNTKINVFVALSSVNIYSQVFTLPFMEGKDLEKAIALNVQMVAPLDTANAYFGWQQLGRDEKSLRSEIAAAFADKATVDEMTAALYAAGFVTVGVESRALALVRALREKGAGMEAGSPYLLIDIDNSGIDFLVVRNGKLYFEYATLWTDIADEKGQVAVGKFKEALEVSVRQVLNFYSQHWPQPLAGVILSAVAFEAEAREAVGASVGALPVVPLTLGVGQPISPEWFVALGCGLRGLHDDMNDKEINLSGSAALDTFSEERVLGFLNLWRVLVPVVLGCLIVIFWLADSFLATTKASIESSAAFNQPAGESSDIAALEASSTSFNQLVALVANAEAQINNNYMMIAEINAIAAANGVTVSHISFQAANTPILVAGSAPSEAQVAAFSNAIQNDPHFGTVTLPPLNIQENGGSYSFSMTFPLSSSGF